MLQSTDKA